MLDDSIHNQPEFTVSELSGALKRTLEDAFGYVRVRGEISGYKLAPSGHAYFNLKDEQSVLAAVCWKGSIFRLPFKPEDGVEVICSGRVTTYAGQSKYQIIVETMEPAGIGALMALLEKRKQQLAAEGLFDNSRKRPLPFLPKTIGVVTSPTGAVIRDILHRIRDRFPSHVLLWPVLVQGDQAASQIATAIKGFNQLHGAISKPDILIIARGGGSLEDLWPFNEEVVVRAIAASTIPVISAVGHETDTTLSDYAADVRAPTPTAAAEMAVPVREELFLGIMEARQRLSHAILRQIVEKRTLIEGLARGLPRPQQLLDYAAQRLDIAATRLATALPRLITTKQETLHYLASGLRPQAITKDIFHAENQLSVLTSRLNTIAKHRIEQAEERLHLLARLLESYHYQKVLERGFVLVRGQDKHPITSSTHITAGQILSLEFHDGTKKAVASDGGTTRKKPTPTKKDSKQDTLF